MCLAGKKNGGNANLLLGIDGTGLNSLNGGVPHFLDSGGTRVIVNYYWFIKTSVSLDRDQPVMSSLCVPPCIVSWVL